MTGKYSLNPFRRVPVKLNVLYSFQDHRRHRCYSYCFARQPDTTGHDRDRHQRADDNERISDGERKDAAKDGATVVGPRFVFSLTLILSRCCVFLYTAGLP